LTPVGFSILFVVSFVEPRVLIPDFENQKPDGNELDPNFTSVLVKLELSQWKLSFAAWLKTAATTHTIVRAFKTMPRQFHDHIVLFKPGLFF
jgi:hypothetical protein